MDISYQLFLVWDGITIINTKPPTYKVYNYIRVITCSSVPFIMFINTLQSHFLVHVNVVTDSYRHSSDLEA